MRIAQINVILKMDGGGVVRTDCPEISGPAQSLPSTNCIINYDPYILCSDEYMAHSYKQYFTTKRTYLC